MSTEIELQNIAIWGDSFLDDSDEVRRILERMTGLSVPESLGNQIINVDEDSVASSLIVFSDHGLAQTETTIPAGEHNFLLFTVQEGDLAFSADIDPELVDDFVGVFDEVLSEVELHVTGFNMDFEINRGFHDLKFDIEGPMDFSYDGIRFSDGDFSYIVQARYGNERWTDGPELEHTDEAQSNLAERGDEEQVSQTAEHTISDVTTTEHFDVSDSGDFVRSKVGQAKETLEEITP